jgi:alpha-L-fucosidase
MNNSWGYNKSDKNFKSTHDLVQYLVKAAGNNANFLLNVGPMPDGTIQPEFRQHLAEMGVWLRVNGASVYGTRGGPVPPQSWGVTTQKAGIVYLHVLTNTDQVVAVPDFGKKVLEAKLLTGGKVNFASTGMGTIVQIPKTGRDLYDTVVALTVK